MLKLAKTESKKELSLMKHKKLHEINIIDNRNLTERNELYPLYNASNCRIQHKIVKKSNVINMNDNKNKNQSKTLNKDKAQNSNLISIQNNNIIKSMKNSNSPIASKKKRPLKKIIRVKVLKTSNTNSNSKNKNNIDKISETNDDLNYKKKLGKHKRAETEFNNVLKTTRDARVRKMLSMASDIFNLNKTATNLICSDDNFSPENPKFYKTFYKTKKDNNLDNDIDIIFQKKIKKIDKPILRKKLLNNEDIFNRTQYINEAYPGRKSFLRNMESVKYDIITTRNNDLYEKYNNLSGIKATTPNFEDYEIVVPKEYYKSNINSLKNVFNTNGVHSFGFKEEGDIIAGLNGKYKLKIRLNNKSEKDKNKMIKKVGNKLSKYELELKKNVYDYRKRRTDVTGFGWEPKLKYGLH
jgi:hypothetical protein